MVGGFLVACGSLFYFRSGTAHLFSVIALIYCATQVAYRQGVYSGFARGFREGHENGVHRLLGISDEDASEIDERATEMEMDDTLIKKFDEHKS